MRRMLVPTSLLWTAPIAIVVAVVLTITAAGDPDGDRLGWMALFIPCLIPTGWAVLEPLWARIGEMPGIFVSLVRTVAVPIVVAPVLAATSAITVHVPPAAQLIATTTRDDGWHYFFSTDDGSLLFQTLVLGGLADVFVAMLAGLLLSVFVVIPWFAFARPREFARANMVDLSEEHAAPNTLAGRILAIVIMLTFAVPGLIIVGSNEAYSIDFWEMLVTWPRVFVEPDVFWGDALWMLGVALIPAGVIAVVLVRVLQRPDRSRRARWGVNAKGD